LQRPYGLFPVKASVLRAAYGIGFLPAADFFVFSRSHALRGNAVKGALRRELSAYPTHYIQAARQTGQKLSVRNIS